MVAIGATVKSVFARNELEKWTDFGPFSDSPRYNLQDETYAFQTLSNLLANLTAQFQEVSPETLNEVEWKVLTNGAARPKRLMCLTITSSLADLLDKKSSTAVGGVHAEIMGESRVIYKPSHYFEQKIPGGVARYFDLDKDIENINYLYSFSNNKVGTLFGGIQGFYKLTTQLLVKDKTQRIWAHPSIPDIYKPSYFDIEKDGASPANQCGEENDDKKYWLQKVSPDFQLADVSKMFQPPTPPFDPKLYQA